MKPKLSLVETGTRPNSRRHVETELRDLLRAELALVRTLSEVRSKIGPLKRTYMQKHSIFGLSNEALRRDMTFRRIR